jgi:capsular exopolysaccharide synthesis family protein
MEHIDYFRKLAAALHQAQRERGVRVVMIVSAGPGEGKSQTAANLGRVLSRSYRRRVLLVDADLRRPVLHIVNHVENGFGVDDLLEGDGPIDELPTTNLGPNLELLASGRPNPDPVGALTSPRMRELLACAARQFDWVLVDTPPVSLLPDSELLGSFVDAALLVVAAGETDYRLVTRTVDALGRDKILGVVLNKAEDADAAAPYGASDYAYSYGGGRRAR